MQNGKRKRGGGVQNEALADSYAEEFAKSAFISWPNSSLEEACSLNFGPDERGDVIKRTLRGGGGALFLSEECAEEGDEEEASFSDQKHLPKRFFC